MKTFTKYDYYIQLFFIIVGPQAFIFGGLSGFVLFYFIVGIPQLIGFLIKLFFGYVLMISLLYSPVMAAAYVYDCYKMYEPYKYHSENHLKN